MRRITMSGLVALAALLGSAIPAVTASAATTPTAATSVPAVARLAAAARLDIAARPASASATTDLLIIGDRISCASPTACLAVGTNTGSSGNDSTPVAEALHGTTWRSVAIKAPAGATATAVAGVSCKAATYCLVTGGYSDKEYITHPAAWIWNGTALTQAAAPPMPKADSLQSLSAVSCVAVKSCVAIGSAFGSDTGDDVQIIWTWNGLKWALKTAAMPASAAGAQLTAMRCFSLTSCVVGGTAVSSAATTFAATLVLATWNGKAFTPWQAPAPKGGDFPLVADLACSSAAHCAAVGENVNVSARTETVTGFAEVWNGAAWTVANWPGPKGSSLAALLGVSCTSAASCVAVGGRGTAQAVTAAALTWNGVHWSAVTVPSAGKGVNSDFEGVSCPKAGACVAAGEYGPSTAVSGKPLAGYWNGKAWKLKAA